MITPDNLPRLGGPTWKDAKEWFAALRPHRSGVYVRGWHMDDGFEGGDGITSDATRMISSTAKQILVNSQRWADRSAAYDLCADTQVAAERIWPGFLADVHTSASRTGCVSIPDREYPNFIIEEYNGEFYLLEFTTFGPVSECPLFRMSMIEGAEFDLSASGSADYIDVSNAVVLEGTTREFERIDQADSVIESIHNEVASPRAAPPNP